jgi:AcrR family transcriptional regulator
MSNTREKIVAKALDMYNTHGIEYVGVRELAKELNMKGGNITYYFPTKDDIVVELSQMLGLQNNTIISNKDIPDFTTFLDMFRAVFNNHYNFRSLFLSFPNMLKQNKTIQEQYKKRAVLRKETLVSQIESLIKKGYIKQLTEDEVFAFYNNISIISRFWISNDSVDEELVPKNKVIEKYLHLLSSILSFVATPKGKKELIAYMRQ